MITLQILVTPLKISEPKVTGTEQEDEGGLPSLKCLSRELGIVSTTARIYRVHGHGLGSEPIFINGCMNVILQVHFSTTTCLRYITCSVSLLPLDCCSLACQFQITCFGVPLTVYTQFCLPCELVCVRCCNLVLQLSTIFSVFPEK